MDLLSREAYEKLESHEAADQEGGAAGTSRPHMPSKRNDLWIQAVGGGKGDNVYGTGSLALQPSLYSRALPRAQSTADPVAPSTSFLNMEQMTTMMFNFQRQLKHVMEMVSSTSARDGTTAPSGTPNVPPPPAPPSFTLAIVPSVATLATSPSIAPPATSPSVAPTTTSVPAPVLRRASNKH